ncbi:hypothetical protein [Bacillus marinisedimentorum]|uniref:hypothetical protein n=1 Tax=Bacillus marinisedimentorum TaxID=1821260 RepID=UPI000A6A6DC1|nr:hypothetical protein [Bacillus marinisedimentorum]
MITVTLTSNLNKKEKQLNNTTTLDVVESFAVENLDVDRFFDVIHSIIEKD